MSFFDPKDIVSPEEIEAARKKQEEKKPFFDPADVVDSSVPAATEVSQLESGLRGAVQGATFNFADEIEGAGRAALETLTGDAKLQNIMDTYRQQQQLASQQYEAARQANPGTFFAGEVIGGAATGLATGGAGALAGAAKGTTSLARLAGVGALQGGAAALGATEETNLADKAQDVAVGAGLGAAIPVGVVKATEPVKKAINKVKDIGYSAVLGIPDDVVNFIRTNKEAVMNAPGNREIVNKLRTSIEDTIKEANKVAAKGKSILSKKPSIDAAPIIPMLQDSVEGLDEPGKGLIGKIMNRIESNSTLDVNSGRVLISEKDLKDVLGDIYQLAYKGAGSTKDNLKRAGNVISQQLKESNPEYSKLMEQSSSMFKKAKPMADIFGMSDEVAKDFADMLQSNPDEASSMLRMALGREDTLVTKLNRAGIEDKTRQAFLNDVSNLAEEMGITNARNQIQASAAKEALEDAERVGTDFAKSVRNKLITPPVKKMLLKPDAPPSTITSVVQDLGTSLKNSENSVIRSIGDNIEKASVNNSPMTNATKWNIMQQPAIRQANREVKPQEEKKEGEAVNSNFSLTKPVTKEQKQALPPVESDIRTIAVDPTVQEVERNIRREMKQVGSGASEDFTASKEALLGSINKLNISTEEKMEMQSAAMSSDYARLQGLLDQLRAMK